MTGSATKMSKENKENDPQPLIDAFLAKHTDFEMTKSMGKVHCKVSGHEMPLRMADLEAHLKSKRYISCSKKGRVQLDHDWAQYEPHIISHKKDTKALFCQLTAARLNKNPEEVKKHMNGKRFTAAVKDFEDMVAKDIAGELSDMEDEEEEDSMDELLANDDEENSEEGPFDPEEASELDLEEAEALLKGAEKDAEPAAKRQKVEKASEAKKEEKKGGKKITPMKKADATDAKKLATPEGSASTKKNVQTVKKDGKKKKKGKKNINSKKRRKQKASK